MDTLMKTRNAIPSTYRNLLPESAFMISVRNPTVHKEILSLNPHFFLPQKLYVESTKNVSNIFLTLFKNLSSESPSVYHFTLVQCLKTDPNCVKLWELNHKKLHQQHTALLNYIRKSSS